MDLGLTDKVALVLGAGGGLGSAIARTLAAEGARVAVADINGEAANATVARIRTNGGIADPFVWDLAALDDIDRHVSAIEHRLGPVGIVVNNTAVRPPTPASGQSPKLWADHFNAMVVSVIALTDRLLPAMRKAGWGRVITSTSSVS